MELWRRGSGVLKDKNSIWIASVSRRFKYSHPDLEAAVIKATSHDERVVDYENTRRVFAWIKISHIHLFSFIRVLSRRMERTHNSIVAIKGLMLLHGVLCTKIPSARKIGRLPFDLSNFSGNCSIPSKRWGFDAFVRSYFAFVDQKSVLLSREIQDEIPKSEEDSDAQEMKLKEETITQELIQLQKLQVMLDILLKVQPRRSVMNEVVVLEAMDCVIIEVFDGYSKICNGIAKILMRIYGGAIKVEAEMALDVLKRATRQGDELADYVDLCREIGLLNASECPKVERIPEEDIRELVRIINGVTSGKSEDCCDYVEGDRTIAVVSEQIGFIGEREAHEPPSLKTIITHKWEVFDDVLKVSDLIDLSDEVEKTAIVPFL
ncbi:hypothetical protein Nepgr_015612 [Nepenthes gracilis]|uniref:ENTH domain-containing protein n=1 Tax=Nepenthes gracilis TaxID=150966 RepID=A0AAD3XRG2_NEPGR|nr:hypothetical protein Nepgr_015612 [Nepenthes gracilis]